MNWIERLNGAINYIEENITEELEFAEVAKVAHCSSYHFQRMFMCMTDMSLADYIRRRRMSLAVADLKIDRMRVTDVALKYGYHSPTAFNRAFQKVHGIAPSLIKQDGVVVKSYPPLNFQISIKGAEGMDYRIEKKEAFRIVGVVAEIDDDFEANWDIVSQNWQVAEANGTIDKLSNLSNSEPSGIISAVGVQDYFDDYNHWIGVASTKEIDDSMEEVVIGSFTWAIFQKTGDSKAFFQRIINEWLPNSGYEFDDGPDIEIYQSGHWENETSEVWLPIKKMTTVF